MDDEFAAVLSESYRLLDQSRGADWQHAQWQADRREREFWDPPPPAPAPPAQWMEPAERRRVEAWVAKSISKDRSTMRKNNDRTRLDNMAKAVGEALARERVAMRKHVADAIREVSNRCTTLERQLHESESRRLAEVRAEIVTLSALRDEIGALRSELAELRRERNSGKVIDLPMRGAS
jgi:hypothetical protein